MPNPISIYVHWPFCRRICPYCDFNVRRWRGADLRAIGNAFQADIQQQISNIDKNRHLQSIHFGGGTPSMMPPEIIGEIIQTIQNLLPNNDGLEIALEANPEDNALFPSIAESGITRLTLGIQAINQARLQLLGRQHSPAEALKSIQVARDLFPNIAVDMITATPNLSVEDWREELSLMLQQPIDHLSVYGLTIEAGTAFGKRPPKNMPDNDLDADLMITTRALIMDAGFTHYEVSNFARSGFESRYNSAVWLGQDYIGVGPGAHGRLHQENQRIATRRLPNMRAWQENPTAFEVDYRLSPKEAVQEWLLMGFRLTKGINLAAIPPFIPAHINQENIAKFLLENADFREFQQMGIWHFDGTVLAIDPEASLNLDHWIKTFYAIIEPII